MPPKVIPINTAFAQTHRKLNQALLDRADEAEQEIAQIKHDFNQQLDKAIQCYSDLIDCPDSDIRTIALRRLKYASYEQQSTQNKEP
jgi:F0F1-type ATP synthase membrane subunit b/b'